MAVLLAKIRALLSRKLEIVILGLENAEKTSDLNQLQAELL